jgi:Tfp pilus assembly protein PilF
MTTCLQCGHADAGGFVYCPRCGTKAVGSGGAKDPLIGRILNGKYRIEAQIGQGAMGVVYLGEHLGLRKKVALKLLHADLQVSDESLQRFQREGMAAGRFNHPNAIQVFDLDRGEGGPFYLAMEYVEGVDLGSFLRQRGRLSPAVAVPLVRQIVSCLAEAHRHGIVHRDLKPDNIMVSENVRGELRVKVLDFGLSKLVDLRMGSSLTTQPGRLLGTPLYMAPEQVAGDEADERSDIYATGLILYELVAGERPFREKDAAQLFLTRPVAEAPSLRANVPDLEVPDELEDLLWRSLQRERGLRFQQAEEMLQALDAIPLGTDAAPRAPRAARPARAGATARTPTPVPGAPAAASATSTRRRARFVVAGVAVALIALVAGLLSRGGARGRPALVRAIAEDERSEQERRYVGLLDEARMKLTSGDRQGALTTVNQAFLLDCRDAEVFLVRGEIYGARGDLDSARADFETAAGASEGFAEPRLGLGWIHLERGELDDAARAFEEAAEIAPADADVLAAQGALAWKRGALEEARTTLGRAIAADPACARAHLYLGRIRLDRGELDGAIQSLVEAKRHDPFATRPLLWLAEAYVARDDLAGADAQLEEALRLEPTRAETRVQRGALLLARQDASGALAFLTESCDLLPQEGRLWTLRAVALSESGDTQGACDAFERAFARGVRDPQARCLYGVLLLQARRLPEAIAQLEKAIEEGGELPEANRNLGLALFQQEKYAEASARLERALEFDEEDETAHLYLGLLYKDYLDEPELARGHLERYLALGGADERAARWLERLR